MNKVTDKQMNFIILGVAVLVAIIFFVLRYFDQEEIIKLRAEKQGIDYQIAGLKKKEKEIEAKKADLFLMRENTDAIKRLLPEEKKVTEFFELVEKFRVDNNVEAFDKFKKVDTFFELNQEDGEPKVKKPDNTRRRRTAPTAANPFVEDAYLIEFKGTFNQVGELISRIESYERFFGVKELDLDFYDGSIEVDYFDKKVIGEIKFLLTTFTFQNPDPSIDEKVNNILQGYEDKASDALLKKIEERRTKLLKRYKYTWRKINEKKDPFYPFRVPEIQINTSNEDDLGVEPIISASLEEKYEKITALYNDDLIPKAFESDWLGLQKMLDENTYEEKLKQLKLENFSESFDSEGKKREKLDVMGNDLREWKKDIADANKTLQLRELIDNSIQDVKPLSKMYKKAKKKGSEELYQEIIDLHKKLYPKIREFKNEEKEFPQLAKARKKLEYYNRKATIQLELIERAKKLKLQGIIFQGKNKLNVAFISGAAVKVNSRLNLGFVVKEIHENWVILNYKGEDVPLRKK